MSVSYKQSSSHGSLRKTQGKAQIPEHYHNMRAIIWLSWLMTLDAVMNHHSCDSHTETIMKNTECSWINYWLYEAFVGDYILDFYTHTVQKALDWTLSWLTNTLCQFWREPCNLRCWGNTGRTVLSPQLHKEAISTFTSGLKSTQRAVDTTERQDHSETFTHRCFFNLQPLTLPCLALRRSHSVTESEALYVTVTVRGQRR